MNQVNLTAYYVNIKKKIGKSPADFKELAAEKGFVVDDDLKPGVKAGEVIAWLKADLTWATGMDWHFIIRLKKVTSKKSDAAAHLR